MSGDRNALLQIRALSVEFATAGGALRAVDAVDLDVAAGECLGVVGESGSGKTQLFLAALGLLDATGRASGSVRLDGRDLLGASRPALEAARGRRIGFVFQDPMSALTPHLTIGAQLREVLRLHRGLDARAAQAHALQLLEHVHIGDAAQRLRQYPHELSGGMRQRVTVALALAGDPQILIADEPTTALDVTVQAGVLEVLRELKAQRRLAIVLITHDFGVAASLCERIAVMYAGRIVEQAPALRLFRAPRHPYTRALLQSVPRLDTPADRPLPGIRGAPPRLGEAGPACAFAPRCERADGRCHEQRPLLDDDGSGSRAACHHPYAPGPGMART